MVDGKELKYGFDQNYATGNCHFSNYSSTVVFFVHSLFIYLSTYLYKQGKQNCIKIKSSCGHQKYEKRKTII